VARFDLSLDELRSYRPVVREPADFDQFWSSTLAQARGADWPVVRASVDTPLRLIEVEDLTFAGYGGEPVKAWFLRPATTVEDLPLVVEFIGYGGGRGLPHEHLAWPTAGYAHVVMDTRGQGADWSVGETADPHGIGPSVPGSMTRGIADPSEYYYRRLLTDAVRCVDMAKSLPGVDDERLAVVGTSQGGGIALGVAGLRHDLAAAVFEVPFLCHFERAVGLTDADPYAELARYLATRRDEEEQVFNTLSYFDGVNFARRATVPARFSTGLADVICPPSTVFAAHNHYAGAEKGITVLPFNGHEGRGATAWRHQVDFVATLLGSR
jgi:cephalosporin-C deacetylase